MMNEHPSGSRSGQWPTVGIVEWFHLGEYDRVLHVLDDLKKLGVAELRTGFSWADWHAPQGRTWYEWLIPRLAQEVNVLPCFHYTPPSLGIEPKSAAPPRNPKDYADFLDLMITEFGQHFEWVELWNEPNNLKDWDWRLDPQWSIYSEMIVMAAYWCKQRGKKTVLGGMCPTDLNWLRLMCRRDALRDIDAVGIHGFPETWDFNWEGWKIDIEKVQELLNEFGLDASIWITEAGFSTWMHEEFEQVQSFIKAIQAPAQRMYWYSIHDLHPDVPTQDGLMSDQRHYHMGLKRWTGWPKLLYRLWQQEGLKSIEDAAASLRWRSLTSPYISTQGDPGSAVLITGGAGFVGTNLARRLLSTGQRVRIFDNLARPGVEQNLRRLRQEHGDLLEVEIADVRNQYRLRSALWGISQVYHFAAQAAVTSSLGAPVHDFEVNAKGTLNLLEALRELPSPPPLLFTSTNKVYGSLPDVELEEGSTRYEPVDHHVRSNGISEGCCLDFHSPYGCSKGVADQYVLDYARTFGLQTAVFRMSCVYGPYQLGTEDQGWVAHFLIQGLKERPITIYGDGKQVRDVLFVEDLVNALLTAQENIDTLCGQAFNIGGGPENTVSLLELLDLMGELKVPAPHISFGPPRQGDQRYYVSDYRRFKAATGWTPTVGVSDGLERVQRWLGQTASRATTATW